MRKLDSLSVTGFLAVVRIPFFRGDFPSMAALYALMTGSSLLCGPGCLRGPKRACPATADRAPRGPALPGPADGRAVSDRRRPVPCRLAAGRICLL